MLVCSVALLWYVVHHIRYMLKTWALVMHQVFWLHVQE